MSADGHSISAVGTLDVATITRMAYANMNGSDRQFTKLMENPLSRWVSYLTLPFYFLWAGEGYKYVLDGRIAGCAYLHIQPNSGYIFNVNVNDRYRRKGIAQSLMVKLEEKTRASGRKWTALQVDTDNLAARNLYEKIGYSPYNTSFLRIGMPLLSLISDNQVEDGFIKLRRLSAYNGRQLFNRYLEHERDEGETIGRSAVEDYETGRLGSGPYWSCEVEGKAIGSIVRTKMKNGPVFNLAFKRPAWGPLSLTCAAMAAKADISDGVHGVELVFGSSSHIERAKDALIDVKYEERIQSRMLMFKKLSTDQ